MLVGLLDNMNVYLLPHWYDPYNMPVGAYSLLVMDLGLGYLMTPGLSKDIGYHVTMTIPFLNLQITRSDIRPHIKWAVSLVTAYIW